MYISGAFDVMIICLGIANFAFGVMAAVYAYRFAKALERAGVNQADLRKNEELPIVALTDKAIIAMRNRAENLYTVFVNAAAVFPLLGILGTVWALIEIQGVTGSMNDNFLAALTSTFWGLIFSIIFKAEQTPIEAWLDNGMREAERCLDIGEHKNEET